MKSYSIDFIVKWHEIDLHRRLRPFCFMNVAQELANVHASNLRFGYEELIAVDQVWVLSRFKARFLHYPKWQDRVSARTWHKGRQGIFGLRDFALYDQNGNDAIVATSSWVIINTRTRRIERNNIFNISEEAQSMALQQDAIGEPCDKLTAPGEPEFVRYHHVMYSDIDFNLHANNAKYVEWVLDSFDIEFTKSYTLKEFQINYITEARFGDEVAILKKEAPIPESVRQANSLGPDSISFYIEGRRGDTVIFQAVFTFDKDAAR